MRFSNSADFGGYLKAFNAFSSSAFSPWARLWPVFCAQAQVSLSASPPVWLSALQWAGAFSCLSPLEQGLQLFYFFPLALVLGWRLAPAQLVCHAQDVCPAVGPVQPPEPVARFPSFFVPCPLVPPLALAWPLPAVLLLWRPVRASPVVAAVAVAVAAHKV